MNPRVGLVTVLFNSADVLPGFFQSLSAQSYYDYWLYIIDNSLDELSFESAKKEIEKYNISNVTLIKNDKNVGVAAANNQGIVLALEAKCEYVLVLNNDIEFTDTELFSSMVAVADANNEKLVTPKIYFYDSDLIWCAGGSLSEWRGVVRHYGEMQPDSEKYSSDCYVQYAPTCFMLVHKDVFGRIGLMDEKYFVYYDDVDFIYRSNQAGFKLKYWAEGEVRHKVSSSTGGDESPFSVYYTNRNRIYYIRKNFKGMKKSVAISYTVLTRIVKMANFSNLKRSRKMYDAMIAGFFM